jgi:hypothetical protein
MRSKGTTNPRERSGFSWAMGRASYLESNGVPAGARSARRARFGRILDRASAKEVDMHSRSLTMTLLCLGLALTGCGDDDGTTMDAGGGTDGGGGTEDGGGGADGGGADGGGADGGGADGGGADGGGTDGGGGGGTLMEGEKGCAGGAETCVEGLMCCSGVPYPPDGVCHASCPAVSDRAQKEAIERVDEDAILDRLAALEIAEWSYRAEGEGVRHVGPMAQDFHEAFGLGESDRVIHPVDASGVTMAALQALYRRVEALERENAALREANVALSDRVDRVSR